MINKKILSYIFVLQPFILFNIKIQGCDPTCISLGYVAILDPIITLLCNATMSLSVVAHNAYQSSQQKQLSIQKNESIPLDVILAERSYYENRKHTLQKLRSDFWAVKCGIEAIKELHHTGNTSFTHQFLSKHTSTLPSTIKITHAQEKKLSEDEKHRIRKERQKELALLEQHIYTIQLLLALHVNQLIDEVAQARSLYKQYILDNEHAIENWNNIIENVPIDIAVALYQYTILQEYLLHKIYTTTNELKFIAAYYHTCKSECIKNTTTIVQALEHMTKLIAETSQILTKEEERLHKNNAIVVQYFINHNLSATTLKDSIVKSLNEKQKQHETHILQKLETELSNYSPSGGPKKPKNKDKFENMYEIFKKAPIGKVLQNSVKGTRFSYKDTSKIYRAIKDIPEYCIKKGDWLYLDKMHGDHIEVFKKCGKTIRTVLNMDGSVNTNKLSQAIGRSITRWIE